SFDAVPVPEPPKEPIEIRDRLIGVTGDISAAGWVRKFDCSVEEFLRRSHLGEAPPTYWVRRFYFEFYCQQGRVVIELADPVVEYNAGDGDHEDWRPLPHTTPMPGPPDAKPKPDSIPEIVIVQDDGHVERVDPRDYLDEHGVPRETDTLQWELDKQARAVDRAIQGEDQEDEEDDDRFMAEMELMDHLIDHENGEPVANALYTARNLPSPDEIPEDEIEPLVKGIVGEMAMYGVALDACEHCTLRDIYRIIYENIHTEWRFHPELAGTGWVQHYSTSDYCRKCAEEFEKEFEAEEKARKESEKKQGADE
ncbi:hypothetical protein LLG95_18375, partial [bacterium]|nr:hypothetical protein [bacterium]